MGAVQQQERLRAATAAPALALLLLSLCARAAGSGVFVGDGLYSGGSSEFDLNSSACKSLELPNGPLWPAPARLWHHSAQHAAAQNKLAPRGIFVR
jgi:hypothetical protein